MTVTKNQFHAPYPAYWRRFLPYLIKGAAQIGSNCTIYHCVTIAVEKSGVPVIGDDVTIGAGAIIMGGIKIGNHVNIGAGAIVIDDVPDHSTVMTQYNF